MLLPIFCCMRQLYGAVPTVVKPLHLGGGVGAGEDSLYAFKKTFYRGEPCRYQIGKRIFLSDAYEKLITMRTNLPESGFFPRYRA